MTNPHNRPLIGVPAETLHGHNGSLPRPAWVMGHRYFTALAAVDVVPVMVPLLARDEVTLRSLYERLDGLFLAGGADVDPAGYSEARLDVCGHTDPDRDSVELKLTRWAIEDGKPVFAVCRGLQLLNVACGGSLVQDLPSDARFIVHDHNPPLPESAAAHVTHDVHIDGGSRFARIYGATTITVNSLHHQGIKALGAGLRASVHAPDGLVEGVEGNGRGFVLGVQWHPEMLIEHDAATRRLYEAFAAAAATYRTSS